MDFKKALVIGAEHCSKVKIGGGPPVIQTMWKERLAEADVSGAGLKKTLARIENLSRAGCGVLRFAVPDTDAAALLGRLSRETAVPLVADIHFDYKIALRCLDFPVSKLRINPGNIGAEERVGEVLKKCADKNVPVRIGVNGGSLNADLRALVNKGKLSGTEALVKAAERELAVFDRFNFDSVVVSIKASSVTRTVLAARLFASGNVLPLHIGVTEAGPLVAGVVRNTAALYNLLCDNIGDTLRISLSDSMENEVIAAREILLAVDDYYKEMNTGNPRGRAGSGVRIISCPRCGRCTFDTHLWTRKWLGRLYSIKKDITVAVMGCPVNGPGEARGADLGITGSKDKVILFKNGKIIASLVPEAAPAAFEAELEKLAA